MLDYQELENWIEENVLKKDMGVPTVQRAAIWFVCNQKAELIYSSCTQRDMASLVEKGMEPTNTPEAINSWLEEHHESHDEGEGEEQNDRAAREDMIEKLKEHFGV